MTLDDLERPFRTLADPGMGGPGGRPHGPNIGVFYLNTKLLALLYKNMKIDEKDIFMCI